MPRPGRPHLPMRPLWRCRGCGVEWPCQPAKLSLLSEYQGNRTGLIIYLAQQMVEARDQLHQLNPDKMPDLTERFLAWARPRG
ncbi:flavin reductase [Micromonospora sp. WMMD736]|uniref:flavin reductase n=1 Tax=Micromonospora sp. WMMD736 TaxID=3404112 RepID=UPI003B95B96B